ncbi:MAG: hypothetical protein IT426_01475 [Pirellulales bacterium]|nr:hypothetical protein [Pirellulales bacterium]
MNPVLAFAMLDLAPFDAAPLFAAKGGELLTLLMIVIFIVVPLLGQFLSKMKAPRQQGPARPAKPARPAGQGSVQSEIEAFLRRANQKKETAANRPPRPQPVRAKAAEKPVRAEVVRAEVVRERPVGGEVEKHVKKYLDEEEFVRRSKKLGEEVAETDDKIELHLKSVFDHSLSKIAATPGVTASAPSSKLAGSAPEITTATPSVAAYDVANLLGNPLSVRQAIILSEILNRPLDRWQREAAFDAAAWDRRER